MNSEIDDLTHEIDRIRKTNEDMVRDLESQRQNNEWTIDDLNRKTANSEFELAKLNLLTKKQKNELDYINCESQKFQAQSYADKVYRFKDYIQDIDWKSDQLQRELDQHRQDWDSKLMQSQRRAEQMLQA